MLVAQTGDLRPKADSSPSSALGAAATKPDSYHSYGSHTKEIRAASLPEWRRAAVGDEADSLTFTARVRPASPAERPGTKVEARFVSFVCGMAATRTGGSCCFTTGAAQGGDGGRGSRFTVRLRLPGAYYTNRIRACKAPWTIMTTRTQGGRPVARAGKQTKEQGIPLKLPLSK